MSKLKAFLKRKNIEISWKRYGIDALGAMAQGLFCSLLIGTIIKTVGVLSGWQFFLIPWCCSHWRQSVGRQMPRAAQAAR